MDKLCQSAANRTGKSLNVDSRVITEILRDESDKGLVSKIKRTAKLIATQVASTVLDEKRTRAGLEKNHGKRCGPSGINMEKVFMLDDHNSDALEWEQNHLKHIGDTVDALKTEPMRLRHLKAWPMKRGKPVYEFRRSVSYLKMLHDHANMKKHSAVWQILAQRHEILKKAARRLVKEDLNKVGYEEVGPGEEGLRIKNARNIFTLKFSPYELEKPVLINDKFRDLDDVREKHGKPIPE